MWISPKPMVDGFVEIFDEFRNGCDEKSAMKTRHSPHRTLTKFQNHLPLHLLPFFKNPKKLCE